MLNFNLLQYIFTENKIWRSLYYFDINYPILTYFYFILNKNVIQNLDFQATTNE